MSDICISPSAVFGRVSAPPSKSDVHRAIICASLAKGKSRISPVALSQDILATIDCIKALGAQIQLDGSGIIVDSTKINTTEKAEMMCRESGSTLRFLIPVAASLGVNAVFTGKGRLPQRPIGVFTDILPKHNVECITNGGLPFEIKGRLTSGRFEVPGDISSQFITGLLFALPLLDGDSVISLTTPLQSQGYINMTLDVMKSFGIDVKYNDNEFFVKGGQKYIPHDYTTEGDWSQAAFFMVGGAIGGSATVCGVRKNSYQGDKKIAELLEQFGAKVEQSDDTVTVSKGELKGIDIDVSQIPDLVPILSVCACFAKGKTHIYNAGRVRLKESDRLTAIANALNACGGNVTEEPEGLIIEGVPSLKGGFADGCNDHRIVMSMAIAALCSEEGITISDKESITKSYDNFFDDLICIKWKVESGNIENFKLHT
ncbi:MAG: 3-phosphoshikimate 1-carboxyvinyltransferase [Clostridia bacterium]|nr:3-phosphoshikimate 1-carboxyvinyltransferase [Clostridia bacterium]MBQ5440228.1 3-phosphoshikimate 1-carboxyvinyltransferase [Clostridia bacterium]